MAQKKRSGGAGGGDDADDLARSSLQAVLLADSFAQKFRPITLERPKVLMPLVGVPMIDYTLAWLESVGVEEVFVFCCAHAKQIKDHLAAARWDRRGLAVTAIESRDAISAGDALRFIYNQGVIRGDFILISGDTISNMNLKQALEEHKERRKKDPLAVMTMVIKRAKTSTLTHQTRHGTDGIMMAIQSDTKELLCYEDRVDNSRRFINLDKHLLASSPSVTFYNDKEDCYIDMCSPEVLSLFTDNFDYQHLRRHFVKGLLVDDIMGYKIHTHEIRSSYAARIDNFRSYNAVSKDIIQRWTYPFVPDLLSVGSSAPIKLHRQGLYKATDVILSHTTQISADSVIGSGTRIGHHTTILNSVIGEGCIIGQNVSIHGSYIWDKVVIEDGCKLSYALVVDGVHLRSGTVLQPGSILSFKVQVGGNIVIPSYSKVSSLPQPTNQDSDDELEYADTNIGNVDSTSPAGKVTENNSDLVTEADPSTISQLGVGGSGYIWSSCENGCDEDWKQSIAPVPKEKLADLSNGTSDDSDELDVLSNVQPQQEISVESASEDDDNEDFGDVSKFEKEVEETFQRALGGVQLDNLILEINALRLTYNMSQDDCAGALFYSVLKSALAAAHSSNESLVKLTFEAIDKWKGLLSHYIRTSDEGIEVILKFEEMCQETEKEFTPHFSRILHQLYDKDIITEDVILLWAKEKEGADDADKFFLKQSEAFITWLREAPEEDEDE